MSRVLAKNLFVSYSQDTSNDIIASKKIEKSIDTLIKETQRLNIDFFELTSIEKAEVNEDYIGVIQCMEKYLGIVREELESTHSTRIKIMESEKAVSHNHNMGGDVAVLKNPVANAFFEMGFVDKIFLTQDGGIDHFLLLVDDDDDDISLKLARIKLNISRTDPDYYFEMSYLTHEEFDDSVVQHGAQVFLRG